MNRHLNIFRPFSQNLSKENIEDNLSRAFVLCLQNNSLLFHEFLRTIFSETNQQQVFDNVLMDSSEKDTYSIDIQVDTSQVNDQPTKVFALTMSGIPVDMTNFFTFKPDTEKKHITDIFITINDIVVIIEVKRNNVDCREQLYNQVASLINKEVTKENVFPLDYNWKKLMQLVNRVNGFQSLINNKDSQLIDFIDLVQTYNPNWLPIPAIASLHDNNTNESKFKLQKRLNAALKNIENKGDAILNYNDRIGLALDYGWAKEIVLNIGANPNNALNVKFGIWPGNTKGQGTQLLKLLKNKQNWSPPNYIEINNIKCKIDWCYEIKFCHFNKYICNVIVKDEELKEGKKIISEDVHWKFTGKYDRINWGLLEGFLDDNIKEEINWRAQSKWVNNFKETNRNYVTVSIGYQIETIVPVSLLQVIDKEVDNLEPLSNLILDVKKQYNELFTN